MKLRFQFKWGWILIGIPCWGVFRAAEPYGWGKPGSGLCVAAATSCSLHSARMCIRAHPFFLMTVFGVFVVHNSDWGVSSVPIVGDSGLILARRVDTWVDPHEEQVGCVVLDCAIALTVSCSLRSPRIASGATRSFLSHFYLSH